MSWISAANMAKELGITTNALRRRRSRGTLGRYGVEHRVKESSFEYRFTDRRHDQEAISLSQQDKKGITKRSSYSYNHGTDEYLVELDTGPTTYPGWLIRGMWKAYTSEATALEVCREYALDVEEFVQLKNRLKLTHSRSSFTDEELQAAIAEGRASDLERSAIKAMERNIARKVQQAKWKRTLNASNKWLNFYDGVLQSVKDLDLPTLQLNTPDTSLCQQEAIICVNDTHIGKKPATYETSLKTQLHDFVAIYSKVVNRVLSLTSLKRVILWLGGDVLHVDNAALMTEKGTPQGSQTIGDLHDHISIALQGLDAIISKILPKVPVHLVWTPGNHDRNSSLVLALVLNERYRNSRGFSADVSRHPHKYVQVLSDIPVLFTHGHGMSRSKYASHLSFACSPKGQLSGCDITQGVALEGHWHTDRADWDSVSGVQVVTCASPACSDEWHRLKGFDLSTKRVCVPIFQEGVGLKEISFEIPALSKFEH